MYRTYSVLPLVALCATLVHSFSWDIAVAARNRLEFYNEGKFTYSVTFADVIVNWLTYDPYQNRVLMMNSSFSLLSFDIATKKSQTFNINFRDLESLHDSNQFAYDPATGKFFTATVNCEVYSYLLNHEPNHKIEAKFVYDFGIFGGYCNGIAVDSCGGYIYWITHHNILQRSRLNDWTVRKVLRRNVDKFMYSLTVNPRTQNIYWTEYNDDYKQSSILGAHSNGEDLRTFYNHYGLTRTDLYRSIRLTESNDSLYWMEAVIDNDNNFFWKIPKNLPIGTSLDHTKIALIDPPTASGLYRFITAKYAIEEQPQGIPLC